MLCKLNLYFEAKDGTMKYLINLTRGVNHSLEIFGNLYNKTEISYAWSRNPFENEKSRKLNVGVIYPSHPNTLFKIFWWFSESWCHYAHAGAHAHHTIHTLIQRPIPILTYRPMLTPIQADIIEESHTRKPLSWTKTFSEIGIHIHSPISTQTHHRLKPTHT